MKRVAIVGAPGSAGAELPAILHRHPGVELVGLYSSSGSSGGAIVPAPGGQAWGAPALHGEPFDLDKLFAAKPDVVFLATPNEVSPGPAPKLPAAALQVIALSGASRLEEPSLSPPW